ncbi:unnamed protein product [Heligmosomoides polygyrus]|uniref:Polyketide synthase n=1 Tax=Heligmosomoides polygyrus TaxID=6339 RepID=A0A183FFW1_HELPZ|nr:unnamed protein product [Heligmosomoides polygyrus]
MPKQTLQPALPPDLLSSIDRVFGYRPAWNACAAPLRTLHPSGSSLCQRVLAAGRPVGSFIRAAAPVAKTKCPAAGGDEVILGGTEGN